MIAPLFAQCDSLCLEGLCCTGHPLFPDRHLHIRGTPRRHLAKAHLAIINQAKDVMLSTAEPGDLLDFLRKPQTAPDLARACKEVLGHLGATPGESTISGLALAAVK